MGMQHVLTYFVWLSNGSFTTGFSFFAECLGKAFAMCYTQQRVLGKQFIGKDLFAECTLSGTRHCRVLI